MKEIVRPVYSELQGYLTQTPSIKSTTDLIYDSAFWEQINSTIDELNSLTNKDYSKYKINTNRSDPDYMQVVVIRVKLGGIISRLHAEYYSDEPAPFSGMPSSVTNITQMQQQTATQTIVLEFQEMINNKLAANPNDEERNFLQKIKNGLGSIRNTVELVKIILDVAKQAGFDIDRVATIFS